MTKEILRKCQSCQKIKKREDLIRITKIGENLKINPDSKELGRSTYVCKDIDCVKNFIKKHKIKSTLKFSNMSEIEKIEIELLKFFENT